jgi:hypothetical protein
MFRYNCSGIWRQEAMKCTILCGLRVGLHISNARVRTKICMELKSVARHEEDTPLLGASALTKTMHLQN